MTPELRALLELTNPWLGDPVAAQRAARRRIPENLLPRAAAPGLAAALEDRRHAHLVIGPRQAGKSTLVWSLLSARPQPLLFLNCEETLIRQWCSSPALFVGDLVEWLPEDGVVFLEEAQWLDEAGLFLKGLVDAQTGRRIVVTGSSSYHLLARTRESLAGRATRHALWPLSLREIVPASDSSPAAFRRARREAMERQLLVGGYPEVWTSQRAESVLQELLTAFVLRDASDRFRIERPDAFRLLLRLIAGQVGDVASFSEWSHILGIAVSTVSDYVALLEETHLVRRVRPFIGGKRAELTQAPRFYFLDNGLRNLLVGGLTPIDERADLGKLMENWVASELHKRYSEPGEVRSWRTTGGAEMDFVLEPRQGVLVGIEVKARTGGSLKITRSMHSFIEAYQPRRMLLVHRGEPERQGVAGTEVLAVPAELLPEALDDLSELGSE
ncbi:MAG TPA: ATP-binding protein [Thermoanaerobaculia bacterium]|nr:ATP-binding protein [Thermoanaerobaculia bacterium]